MNVLFIKVGLKPPQKSFPNITSKFLQHTDNSRNVLMQVKDLTDVKHRTLPQSKNVCFFASEHQRVHFFCIHIFSTRGSRSH